MLEQRKQHASLQPDKPGVSSCHGALENPFRDLAGTGGLQNTLTPMRVLTAQGQGCIWAESPHCFPPFSTPDIPVVLYSYWKAAFSGSLTHASYLEAGVTVSAQQHYCHQCKCKGSLSSLPLGAGIFYYYLFIFYPVFPQLHEAEL